MKIDFDVDIDFADRDAVLEVLPHIPASIRQQDQLRKHNTGVYFQHMPVDPLTGVAALDYKEAEDVEYFKVDFLNNHVYSQVRDPAHLDRLVNTEPMWEMLEHQEIVEQLFHINTHFDLVKRHHPHSLEELAMLLAIIRPAKRHLQGKSWNEIRKTVWVAPDDDQYYFKKAHAIAYSMVIVVQMNLLAEQASNPFS
jgi:hypothetical protein